MFREESDETGVVGGCGQAQGGGERVGHAAENTSSRNKKKKTKKKKKKPGDGTGVPGGGGGGDRGEGQGSWAVGGDGRPAVVFGAGGESQRDSALLVDERSFEELISSRLLGVRGGVGGKPVAKTLIVGDQGFKPAKALVVQAKDAVSIKAAAVRRNGGHGLDRVLSIGLELPGAHAQAQKVRALSW